MFQQFTNVGHREDRHFPSCSLLLKHNLKMLEAPKLFLLCSCFQITSTLCKSLGLFGYGATEDS